MHYKWYSVHSGVWWNIIAQEKADVDIMNLIVDKYKICLSTEAIYTSNDSSSFSSIVSTLFGADESLCLSQFAKSCKMFQKLK